jgi:hypothetical protein
LAIGVFFIEKRREADNDAAETYQQLSDNYQDFLKVALENADLGLFSASDGPALTTEQRERRFIIFDMLISLFERAYLLLYEEGMDTRESRRWSSWEDYIREWCRRPDFRAALPELLSGEDPDFVRYVERLAEAERRGIVVRGDGVIP